MLYSGLRTGHLWRRVYAGQREYVCQGWHAPEPGPRSVQATLGGCCDPDCGLETCGSEQLDGVEATWMKRSGEVEEDTADARACSCSATGPLSARQKITVVLFFQASATVIAARIYGLI